MECCITKRLQESQIIRQRWQIRPNCAAGNLGAALDWQTCLGHCGFSLLALRCTGCLITCNADSWLCFDVWNSKLIREYFYKSQLFTKLCISGPWARRKADALQASPAVVGFECYKSSSARPREPEAFLEDIFHRSPHLLHQTQLWWELKVRKLQFAFSEEFYVERL